MTLELPAHIAFTRQLPEVVTNLSNSCAQSMTVAELLALTNATFDDCNLTYTSVAGSLALREAILAYQQTLNEKVHSLTAQHVVTFCGAQEALAAIYKTVLSPGDEVIVMTPCYPSLVTMVAQRGCRVVEIKLAEHEQWQFTLSDVAAAISDKTKLIVLNAPHNPTGSVISRSLRQALLQLAQKHQCYLLADDVSQASNYNNEDLAHDYLNYERAISVSVMSKSLGLSGIRVGWAITQCTRLVDGLLAQKAYGSICTSAVDEQLATLALRNFEPIIARNNQIIHQNIEYFQQFVTENSDFISWLAPRAGILSLAKINTALPIEQWCYQLAKRHQTLLLPATLFGLDGQYVRVGLGQRHFNKQLSPLAEYLSLCSQN
ncbi:aminotransferase class I/II-fold pyridoxal phosphate-dependent enzyme [Thalassotalea fusca]